MPRCNGCGALIEFVVMPSGKKMPIDVEPRYMMPDEAGPDTAISRAIGGIVKGEFVERGTERAIVVFSSHFSTCPKAGQFRKREPAPAVDGRAIAKKRDEWLASPDGVECQQGSAEGQYLKNRLERAFLAGVEAARP